jgi:hypothetical protein
MFADEAVEQRRFAGVGTANQRGVAGAMNLKSLVRRHIADAGPTIRAYCGVVLPARQQDDQTCICTAKMSPSNCTAIMSPHEGIPIREREALPEMENH